MGGTNPDEIAIIMQLGVQVRHSNRLHAKVYRFDAEAVVGSANASCNGLGFEGAATGMWSEASVRIAEKALLSEIDRWFDNEWDNAFPVTNADLDRARLAFNERVRLKKSLPKVAKGGHILSVLDEFKKLKKDKAGFYHSGNWHNPGQGFEIIRVFDDRKGLSIRGGRIVDQYKVDDRTVFKFKPDKQQQGKVAPTFRQNGCARTLQ